MTVEQARGELPAHLPEDRPGMTLEQVRGELPAHPARGPAGMTLEQVRGELPAHPARGPAGMTLEQVRNELPPHLPEDLFPGGAKSGGWLKTVQLDLEAKGLLVRSRSTPLRLRRAGGDERRAGDDPGDAAPP